VILPIFSGSWNEAAHAFNFRAKTSPTRVGVALPLKRFSALLLRKFNAAALPALNSAAGPELAAMTSSQIFSMHRCSACTQARL